MFDNVCRLCLGTTDLMSIFDKRMADNMPEVIEVTSGVKITKSDTVTQMVCSTCCQITIKMFRFRTTSIRNDKDLKARCGNTQLPNANKAETSLESTISSTSSTSNIPKLKKLKIVLNNANTVPTITNKPQIPQKYRCAHPSIKEIVRKYPNIKLPQMSLKAHFEPSITLLTAEVDDWYKEKNYSDVAIQDIKKRAFEQAMKNENFPEVPQRKRRRKKLFTDKTTSEISNGTSPDANVSKASVDENLSAVTTNNNKKVGVNTSTNEGTITPTTDLLINSDTPSDDITKEAENSPANICVTLKPLPTTTDQLVVSNNADNIKDHSYSIPIDKVDNADSVTNNKESSAMPESIPILNRDIISGEKNTEITLKSLLETSKFVETGNTTDQNRDVHSNRELRIGQMLHKSLENKNDESQNKSISADVEPSNGRVNGVCKGSFVRGLEETVILSDSEDEDKGNNKVENENNLSNLTSSDKTMQEVSDSSTGHSSNSSNTDKDTEESLDMANRKRDFVKSLCLAPKYGSNTPDFSMLSANKINTLYRCKICDSHHSSTRELIKHCKRIHSKCPFCGRRFRNMMIREQHIRNECKAKSHFELKIPKVALVRVDEVKDITDKYPKAFQEFKKPINIDISEDSSKTTSTELANPQSELPPQLPKPSSSALPVADESTSTTSRLKDLLLTSLKPSTVSSEKPGTKASVPKKTPASNAAEKYDAETEKAVRELEKFLDNAPASLFSEQNATVSSTDLNNQVDYTNAAAESLTETESNNPDIICISDDENDTLSKPNVEDKPSKRIKIRNNEILKNINLQDNDLNLLKTILTEATNHKLTSDIPGIPGNIILDGGSSKIKVFKNLRKYLQHYKIPIEISCNSEFKVNFKYARPSNQKKIYKDIWTNITPEDLKPLNNVKSTQVNPLKTSHEVSTHTYTRNIGSTTICSRPQTISFLVPTPSGFQSNVGGMEGQKNVTQNPSQMNNVPKSVPASTNVYLAPACSVMNTQVNQTLTTNTPMLVNGTQNMYVSPGNNSYANIIIALPTSLVSTPGTTSVASLPATQGPLPVIQSVISGREFVRTSTTNSNDMVNAPLPNNQPVQASIRVKDIRELS